MPKFPGLSGEDVIKALIKLGFARVRQSGSHVLLRKDAVACVVPLHRELKVGTVNGVLRQARLDPAEFAKVL